MCSSVATQLIAIAPILQIQTFSLLNAGLVTSTLRLTLVKYRSPSRLVHVVALAESKCFATLSPPPQTENTNDEKKSLAYLEMRLILARMLWSFDMQLSTECEDWDDQKTWIQWDKKPLLVKLSLVGRPE